MSDNARETEESGPLRFNSGRTRCRYSYSRNDAVAYVSSAVGRRAASINASIGLFPFSRSSFREVLGKFSERGKKRDELTCEMRYGKMPPNRKSLFSEVNSRLIDVPYEEANINDPKADREEVEKRIVEAIEQLDKLYELEKTEGKAKLRRVKVTLTLHPVVAKMLIDLQAVYGVVSETQLIGYLIIAHHHRIYRTVTSELKGVVKHPALKANFPKINELWRSLIYRAAKLRGTTVAKKLLDSPLARIRKD